MSPTKYKILFRTKSGLYTYFVYAFNGDDAEGIAWARHLMLYPADLYVNSSMEVDV